MSQIATSRVATVDVYWLSARVEAGVGGGSEGWKAGWYDGKYERAARDDGEGALLGHRPARACVRRIGG